jgi:hypothetical protein
MKKSTEEMCIELENDIKEAYEGNVTIPDAEKLAAKFLGAQMVLARELSIIDLSARMCKSGVKAVKAAVYLNEAGAQEKKPSDVMLNAKVDSNELVEKSQKDLDEAEVERDLLDNYAHVFKEAHVYFRGVCKGKYE